MRSTDVFTCSSTGRVEPGATITVAGELRRRGNLRFARGGAVAPRRVAVLSVVRPGPAQDSRYRPFSVPQVLNRGSRRGSKVRRLCRDRKRANCRGAGLCSRGSRRAGVGWPLHIAPGPRPAARGSDDPVPSGEALRLDQPFSRPDRGRRAHLRFCRWATDRSPRGIAYEVPAMLWAARSKRPPAARCRRARSNHATVGRRAARPPPRRHAAPSARVPLASQGLAAFSRRYRYSISIITCPIPRGDRLRPVSYHALGVVSPRPRSSATTSRFYQSDARGPGRGGQRQPRLPDNVHVGSGASCSPDSSSGMARISAPTRRDPDFPPTRPWSETRSRCHLLPARGPRPDWATHRHDRGCDQGLSGGSDRRAGDSADIGRVEPIAYQLVRTNKRAVRGIQALGARAAPPAAAAARSLRCCGDG